MLSLSLSQRPPAHLLSLFLCSTVEILILVLASESPKYSLVTRKKTKNCTSTVKAARKLCFLPLPHLSPPTISNLLMFLITLYSRHYQNTHLPLLVCVVVLATTKGKRRMKWRKKSFFIVSDLLRNTYTYRFETYCFMCRNNKSLSICVITIKGIQFEKNQSHSDFLYSGYARFSQMYM